jgi:hypothetical protein
MAYLKQGARQSSVLGTSQSILRETLEFFWIEEMPPSKLVNRKMRRIAADDADCDAFRGMQLRDST